MATKWMIQRVVDERSSKICEEIERIALANGGLTFPIVVGKYVYRAEDILPKNASATGYYTHLFHDHCRSYLYPISGAGAQLIKAKGGEIDEIDSVMLESGALRHVAEIDMQQDPTIEEEVKRDYFLNRVFQSVKGALSRIARALRSLFRR